MSKSKNKLILIWAILIFIHFIIAVALPEDRNPGILLIYLTIVVLSKVGLPVFLNPYIGWGWPSPNWIGWSAGIILWGIAYLGIAYIITKNITKQSTGPGQPADGG